MELTQKQQEVLDFIQTYFARQGMAPSVREIAGELGKSAQAIQQHIESLRAKGYLQHQPSKSRTNVPVQGQAYSHERMNEVPILGRVQAGLPVLAEENIEGTVALPREWARDDKVFLEIVVARVHQLDATLKRFYCRANRVVLKAENPKYDPIEATGDEVEVIGKLIGIYRKVV